MTEKQKLIKRYYDDYREYLLRIACAQINNEADAEDIVQEVFIRAMDSLDKLMACEDPRAWLAATLKNCIRNYRRLHANKLNTSLEEMADLAAPEDPEPLSHILPGQLSAGDREILIWRIEQRMSYQEMSERLGISQAACRVKVCRIVKKCRRLMTRE